MTINPTAAGGFSAAATTYARIRPTYARAAIGELKTAIGTTGPVLDVAAGTGILTGQLHRAGLAVLAVEPVPEMLAQLERSLPSVPAVRAVAERLPVATGVLWAVVVGQAFHWFDAAASIGEAARTLRVDGTLAMLWNRRDDSVDWVREFGEIVLSERREGRPYRHDTDWELVVANSGAFDEARRSVHVNPHATSAGALVEAAASTSFVADATPAARSRVLDRVRELAATHPQLAGRAAFELPYRTEVHLWRRAT